ncbi:MAG: TonB-dependent receptor, partial [Pseudomonadota bacterium]
AIATDAIIRSQIVDAGHHGYVVGEYVREFPFKNFIDGVNITGEINWDIGDFTVTSVTGYRDSDEQLFEENIGAPSVIGPFAPVPVPIFVANRIQEYEQISEELRIAGDLTDDITMVSGIYYLRTDYSIRGDGGPLGTALGTGTAFILGLPVSDFTAAQTTNAVAGFFDGTWQITDRFSFSGGARVTYDQKDFEIEFIPCGGCATVGSTSASEEWLRPTGRGIFQYEFTPDVMGFAGWSRGFRSGGFNGRAASLTAVGPYDPETVDSFEGGFRTEWFDNTLRLNPTFFYALYKDKQEEIIRAAQDGSGVTETVVQNASEVTIWGVELEALAQPTPELTFRASAGYLNTEIDEFLIEDVDLINPLSPRFDPTADPLNLPIVDVADSRALRRAPEFQFAVGADYVRPIMDGRMQLTFSTAYTWSDEFAASPVIDTVPGERRHIITSDGSADFSLTLETVNEEGGNLSLTGYVKDAFDPDVGRQSNSLDAGLFYFAAGQPTTVYGLEAVISFN